MDLGKCNSGRALIGYHPAEGRRVVDSSREIDVVVAGAACGPSGLAEKSPGLRGTDGLAVGNLDAAHIGRRQKR